MMGYTGLGHLKRRNIRQGVWCGGCWWCGWYCCHGGLLALHFSALTMKISLLDSTNLMYRVERLLTNCTNLLLLLMMMTMIASLQWHGWFSWHSPSRWSCWCRSSCKLIIERFSASCSSWWCKPSFYAWCCAPLLNSRSWVPLVELTLFDNVSSDHLLRWSCIVSLSAMLIMASLPLLLIMTSMLSMSIFLVCFVLTNSMSLMKKMFFLSMLSGCLT